ncbi:MAG: diacylglycerol kinase family protein [Armatimonadota bacterium]
MRALLVCNPHAGGVHGEAALASIERRLRLARVEPERVPGADPSSVCANLQAALRGARPDEARVICIGGDGTINGILPALVGTGFPLAIIPAGTFNALAGELGIPRDVGCAVSVALTGRPRRIDIGLANGKPFCQIAGAGFDAAAVHTVLPQRNKNLLSPAALVRGLRLLAGYRSPWVRVTADGIVLESRAWLALIANASMYTYSIRAAPGARVDDALLDLWLFEGRTPAYAARQVAAILRGRAGAAAGARRVQAREIRLASDPRMFLHCDGDAAGTTPAEFEVVPGALTVFVPA